MDETDGHGTSPELSSPSIPSRNDRSAARGSMVNIFSSQPRRPKKQRTGWLRSFRRNGYFVRHVAILTLLLGASVHLAVAALGRSAHPRIVTPPFELLLTALIAYVSVMGWYAWSTFQYRSRRQKILLALILVYFPIGIPLHVITIINGNADHYGVFPGWYSFAILPVMLAMIFFARLSNADRKEDDHIGR
jgi:hypothetical protein